MRQIPCAGLALLWVLVGTGIDAIGAPAPDRARARESSAASSGAAAASQPAESQVPMGYRGLVIPGPPRVGRATAGGPPIAVYAEAVEKTFFVYAGVPGGEGLSAARPGIMAGCFDHATRRVARPTVVTEYGMDPALNLDQEGRVWVFTERGEVFRGQKLYDISAFERVVANKTAQGEAVRWGAGSTNPQPWWLGGQGWMLLGNVPGGRAGTPIAFSSSRDGRTWPEPSPISTIDAGSAIGSRMGQAGGVQVSAAFKNKIATAFSFTIIALPGELVSEYTTNLYYLESADGGKTWTAAARGPLTLPLTSSDNPALVFDYQAARQAVRPLDLSFDALGNPVILYLLHPLGSRVTGAQSTLWAVARWSGRGWHTSGTIRSHSPGDVGCLQVEPRNVWRLVAPTRPGPEPDAPGGEVAMWTSDDAGRSWSQLPLTRGSSSNQNYVRRPVNAQPDFYALWCDAGAEQGAPGNLYFATQQGRVFRLPQAMESSFADPIALAQPPPEGPRHLTSAPASQPE